MDCSWPGEAAVSGKTPSQSSSAPIPPLHLPPHIISPLLGEEHSVEDEAPAGGLGLGLATYKFSLVEGGGGVVEVVTAVLSLPWL